MINRDGNTKSIWQEIPSYTTTNKHKAGIQYDVAIVGGGITGITTALLLQQNGKRCIVLEAQSLCFGSTSGTTAHVNTLIDTPYTDIVSDFGKDAAALVAKATKEAIELIKTNILNEHIDADFKELDGFLFSKTEDQDKDVQQLYEAAAAAGLSIAFTHNIPLPIEHKKALRVNGQAQIHPVAYVHGMAKAFEQLGGVIVQQALVSEADEKDIITLSTSIGNVEANALIYATHIPPGINLLHLRCAPYRSYAVAAVLEEGEVYPDGLVYDCDEPYHYYRTYEKDGQNYLIAGGEDHKTGHESNPANRFRKLEALVREQFKVKEIVYQWSSQYFEPADGLPYIGHLPGHEKNVYTATGFSGNGITFSQIAALILKDMILGNENEYAALFKPSRVKPIAGFNNFVKENADVVKKFTGACFHTEKLAEIADLAPGEGRVVKYETHTIGLYKDESGNLHAVNPVCTHMKCTVEWNDSEKSWDCPCHGGRFSCEGKVLTGPVSFDLEKIEISSLTSNNEINETS